MKVNVFGVTTPITDGLKYGGDFEVGVGYCFGDLVTHGGRLYRCRKSVRRAVSIEDHFDEVPRTVSIVAGNRKDFEQLAKQASANAPLQRLKKLFTLDLNH